MGIAAKLLKAQLNASVVAKNAKNSHHGYNYAPADLVSAEGKVVLNDAGLALVNTGFFIDRARQVITGSFALLDSESEEKLDLSAELPFVPGNGRPDDKAALASLTELRGYLMIGLLQIERVDSGQNDVSGRDDSAYQRPQPTQQQQYRQSQPQQRSGELGQCKDCGAQQVVYKSGKIGCSQYCWKNRPPQQQQEPVHNGAEY